jgi:nitrogen fixation/metabolism regulation signal transduction histidine kinase
MITNHPILPDSISAMYDEMIKSWLTREAIIMKGSFEEQANNLYQFAKAIAYDMYTKRKAVIGVDELMKLKEYSNIEISTMDALSRSFLVRDKMGDYSFIHKSIFEYFVALYFYENIMKDNDIPGDIEPSIREMIKGLIETRKEKLF